MVEEYRHDRCIFTPGMHITLIKPPDNSWGLLDDYEVDLYISDKMDRYVGRQLDITTTSALYYQSRYITYYGHLWHIAWTEHRCKNYIDIYDELERVLYNS